MIWKKIDDYDYSINENGEVRNDKTGRIRKPCTCNKGYHYIDLWKNKVRKCFRLHRLLAKFFLEDYSEDLVVDHIDRNPLNNSLENLRMVTLQQNNCNRTKGQNCSSIFKGVSFDKSRNKWESYISINDKKIHIGRYETELEAGLAFNKYLDDNNLIYYSKNDI